MSGTNRLRGFFLGGPPVERLVRDDLLNWTADVSVNNVGAVQISLVRLVGAAVEQQRFGSSVYRKLPSDCQMIANGRNQLNRSGRSPKPLPNVRLGCSVMGPASDGFSAEASDTPDKARGN
jgi:hypothetical protein